MATTNNYGVRQALNNKGVKNNQIGYKDGFVTVNGKNFLKPGSVANGSAMSTQQNFNNAWQGMTPTKPVSVPTVAKASPMVQAANNVRNNTTTPTFTPPTPRTEQTLNTLSGLATTQAAPLPEFKYDAQSDPAYQAALREAQANLGTAQRNTNAGLRATGQGRSSYSETLANQLANRSMESIANTTLPQMMQQAYTRYIDKANYDKDARQNQINNLAALYASQYQQDVTKPLAEAQQTGNYMPTDAQQLISQLIPLKRQAEAKGVTAEERSGYNSQANDIRDTLLSMGIDPTKYGANVNANQASQNANVGMRTLQGQQVDQQRKESNLNAANVVSQITGRAVTPQDDWQGLMRQANSPNAPLTLQAQEQQFNQAQKSFESQLSQDKFEEDVRQFGMQYAISQQQLALSQDDNARQWADLDYKQATSSGASGGLTANQVVSNMKSLYSEPVYGTNADGDSVKEGTRITSDPKKRLEMFKNVVDQDRPDDETRQILYSLGMTKDEISGYKKLYPGN
ncbi:hypothetical protein [Paenibacillus polymyxa]|uniref:hypothetical protein n=1 Tax=Paenibacillus polymyxa TaxID=1406 RepID=UPI002378D825|nr:hypothetical protein [Paenibacillus polymyxa]WDM22656.1 hypothetical protein J4I02_03275 [Paenibacillus polymyxa]